MSSSDSSETKETENTSQLAFVLPLKEEPVILNKSQIPSVKTVKAAAISRLIKAYETTFGKRITAEQVKKKLNNMKGEIKKKTDKNATGNRKIVLKPWEEEFLKLLDFKGKNPSIHEVPGAVTILKCKENREAVLDRQDNYISHPSKRNLGSQEKLSHSVFSPLETEETKKLSTNELQRLVLLEQLHYIREKRQKFQAEHENTTSRSGWLQETEPIYTKL